MIRARLSTWTLSSAALFSTRASILVLPAPLRRVSRIPQGAEPGDLRRVLGPARLLRGQNGVAAARPLLRRRVRAVEPGLRHVLPSAGSPLGEAAAACSVA